MLASENIDSTIGVDPITQIQTELRDYSALLEKTENGAVLSKQLAQLSEDIVECPSVWEKVDLRNVISTAAFTEAIKDQSRNRFDWHAFWELLRNILVLFPVLLTWSCPRRSDRRCQNATLSQWKWSAR